MNDFSLDRKPWIYIRFGIGILSLVAAISILFGNLGDLKLFDYSMISAFTLAAITHMTDDFGLNRSYLDQKEDFLIIKWISYNRVKRIEFHDIKSVSLYRKEIIISMETGKSLKLGLNTFRREQKNDIYKFFINLAGNHKFTLSRQFS